MSEDLSKLNLVELLERLEPVPEPPDVSLFPQTEGWIGLVIALVALVAWFAYLGVRHHRVNAYRRAALREVAAADNDPVAIAAILRRTALAAFPRAEVAGLHGAEWLAFLDRTYPGTGFSGGSARVLATAPYAPTAEAPDLAPLAAAWVRRHRRNGARGR